MKKIHIKVLHECTINRGQQCNQTDDDNTYQEVVGMTYISKDEHNTGCIVYTAIVYTMTQ